jgi:hypothetical protein
VIQPATITETVRGVHPARIAHAEDPAQPGTAMCGTKLGHRPTSAASELCVVCLDLIRRSFVGR